MFDLQSLDPVDLEALARAGEIRAIEDDAERCGQVASVIRQAFKAGVSARCHMLLRSVVDYPIATTGGTISLTHPTYRGGVDWVRVARTVIDDEVMKRRFWGWIALERDWGQLYLDDKIIWQVDAILWPLDRRTYQAEATETDSDD